MTIQRARELMGDELKGKTDNEVLDFIQTTEALADIIMDMSTKEILEQKKRGIKHPNPKYMKHKC